MLSYAVIFNMNTGGGLSPETHKTPLDPLLHDLSPSYMRNTRGELGL